MQVSRHFLGWDGPVTDKVCGFLLADHDDTPVNLEGILIVVPTAQAGRRLREALARHCSDKGTALLAPRVVTPPYFLRSEEGQTKIATQVLMRATWTAMLQRIDLKNYRALFPVDNIKPDHNWALHTGDMIQGLRSVLADGGYGISDVIRKCKDGLEEPDRWHDLAKLESEYLRGLETMGLEDPCRSKIKDAQKAKIPEGVHTIVVAAVPDPSLLMIQALEHAARRQHVDVLIHAPANLGGHFDGWGRPLPGKWIDEVIEIPDVDRNIVLAGTPASQSERVVTEIATESKNVGPADIAVGVPDRTVTPFLETDLAEYGLRAFDPADKPLRDHPLFRLVEAICQLALDRTWRGFGTLLRQPDLLKYLQAQHQISAQDLLTQYDEFQNRYLPARLEDAMSTLNNLAYPHDAPADTEVVPPAANSQTGGSGSVPTAEPFHGLQRNSGLGDLKKTLGLLMPDLDALSDRLEETLRRFLETVYADREIDPGKPEDEEFRSAAQQFDKTLRELRDAKVARISLSPAALLRVFLQTLSELEYHRDRTDAVIDLEGWLELAWNDASLLIVTGMNEGCVPDSRMSDVFLPDALRARLGLRDDAQRLARDAFLMRGLVESRRGKGRVCFIAGKTRSTGDPLKPSRLLFRCSDDQLVKRAQILFGEPQEEYPNPPSTVSFVLDPTPPDDLAPPAPEIERLSVTSFRDYLACPFRFYLKHVLGMKELDNRKRGLDALDFGTIVHGALQAMYDDRDMRHCTDEQKLGAFLGAQAEAWVNRHFGTAHPLPVTIALDAARQRLSAAAGIQRLLIEDGWRIAAAEVKLQAEMGGITVSGMIDRIDTHPDGRVRIIDYKTSDSETDPQKAHLGSAQDSAPEYAVVNVNGKDGRWTDLQLPLYRLLVDTHAEELGIETESVELAYFNLPKSTSHTNLYPWKDYTPALQSAAESCARTIVEQIKRGVFGPPAERPKYDDFEKLFPASPELCVDMKKLEALTKKP